MLLLNPLSANITKWSNTLKQFVGKLPTNCLSVFDHFVGLAIKRLRYGAGHKAELYNSAKYLLEVHENFVSLLPVPSMMVFRRKNLYIKYNCLVIQI